MFAYVWLCVPECECVFVHLNEFRNLKLLLFFLNETILFQFYTPT